MLAGYSARRASPLPETRLRVLPCGIGQAIQSRLAALNSPCPSRRPPRKSEIVLAASDTGHYFGQVQFQEVCPVRPPPARLRSLGEPLRRMQLEFRCPV